MEDEGDSNESEEEEIPCVQTKEARLGLELRLDISNSSPTVLTLTLMIYAIFEFA